MSKVRMGRVLVALAIASSATSALADGHLLAVGGMLRASNLPVYHKFVDLAGGAGAAKIVIFPTASGSLGSSKRFQAELVASGVPALRSNTRPSPKSAKAQASSGWFC